jgi:hypothetical protein
MKHASFLALVAACSFPRASDNFECTVDSDCASLGGRICESGFCIVGERQDDGGTPDGESFDCTAWTPPRHFMPCDIPEPTGGLTIDGAATYNTTTGELTGAGASPPSQVVNGSMLISVSSFTVTAGGTLRVIGDKPLIVASWTTIEIAGLIDAGSNATDNGAGANPTDATNGCQTHVATVGGNNDNGASGGGGGGYLAKGGNGGQGDGGANRGQGGAAIAQLLLLGGCAGAAGGTGNNNETGGAGGPGGGAIQLTAQTSITITGKINAGGGGGLGGKTNNNGTQDGGGGGGGGSGGMIGLEAPAVTVMANAAIAANGGGGGQGGGDTMQGSTGEPGTPSATAAAGGSAGDSVNGHGGAGSAGAAVVGTIGQDSGQNGGGGGGGAAGFIVIAGSQTIDPAAVVSPAAVAPIP